MGALGEQWSGPHPEPLGKLRVRRTSLDLPLRKPTARLPQGTGLFRRSRRSGNGGAFHDQELEKKAREDTGRRCRWRQGADHLERGRPVLIERVHAEGEVPALTATITLLMQAAETGDPQDVTAATDATEVVLRTSHLH